MSKEKFHNYERYSEALESSRSMEKFHAHRKVS